MKIPSMHAMTAVAVALLGGTCSSLSAGTHYVDTTNPNLVSSYPPWSFMAEHRPQNPSDRHAGHIGADAAQQTATLANGVVPSVPFVASSRPAQPVLQGEAATARLKQQGHYTSLMQAVQAARYAVEAVPAGAADGEGAACYASNPAHSLRCWFRAGGLELKSGGTASWRLNLHLVGYGRKMLEPAEVDRVDASENRVELSRAGGGVVEWYKNTPAGLEQGFTIQHASQGSGPLQLVLQGQGDLCPELETPQCEATSPDSRSQAESSAKFVNAKHQVVLRYSGLKVWDTTQRQLPAHIEVHGRQLVLVIDDRGASYPVSVDPIITSQEAQLQPVAIGTEADDEFGVSVSLSADGGTALVGAYADDTWASYHAGSAYVFVRSGESWIQQGYRLLVADGETNDRFGYSVSLSADGNTALIGAPFDETPSGTNAGSAYVFVRYGEYWYRQAQLNGTWITGLDHFGASVCLSADGGTALVGAPYTDEPSGLRDTGCAYVFVRSGENWTQQDQLYGIWMSGLDHFGVSVCLSADGSTALVGAPYTDGLTGLSNPGIAYVFVRSGGIWSQQGPPLTAADAEADDCFGWSVSLSADGDTALVGVPFDETPAGINDAGSAYVFVRSGGSWSQQGPPLTAADAEAGDWFGSSVSLSADGDTALVGAYYDDTPAGEDAGSAYVFVRSGGSWSQQGPPLTAADAGVSDWFGWSVSLSADGDTALVGAPYADTPVATNAGSAYVFARSGGSWSQHAQLTVTGAEQGDEFAYSVSLSADGDTALVGAPNDDTPAGYNAGSAYVFVRSDGSWSQQGPPLMAPDAEAYDEFGVSVSLSADGGTALVGAQADDRFLARPHAGSAYVFVRSGGSWSQQGQLAAADGEDYDRFGASVCLSADGDTALVGAHNDDTPAGYNAGSAYVFVRSDGSWSQQGPPLTAADAEAYDEFGTSVSLSADGDTALVGAPYADMPAATNAGSAYVFVRSGGSWSQQGPPLRAANATDHDWFGVSVSLSANGNTALVGACGGFSSETWEQGSAYVFVRSGGSWSQQGPPLRAGEVGRIGEEFGYSVSLSADGGTALVGTWDNGEDVWRRQEVGSAYVFVRSGGSWSQQAQLAAADGEEYDQFGVSVSLSADGSTALVGAPFDDTLGGVNAGSAYVFELPNPPPVISTPADLVAEAQAPSGATVTFEVSAEDAVDGPLEVTCVPSSGSVFPLGATTVECTAVDSAGQTASASFTVTVVDTTPPTLTAPADKVVEAVDSSGAIVSFTSAAEDLVDGTVTVSCTPASDSLFPIGGTTVMCTATDSHGNTASASFTVTVVDTTPPTITVPADKVVEAVDSSGAIASFTSAAEDLVDGTVTASCTPASGSLFPIGGTTVTCTATDSHGNTATAVFHVVVTLNSDRAGGGEVTVNEGGVISTPDESVTIIVPSGAVSEDTFLTVAETGTSFELTCNRGNGKAVFGVVIEPSGTVFDVPITIVFHWPDEDNDGKVDGTLIKEENLIITKDNVAVTDKCKDCGACDTEANTWTFQVSSLSEFCLVFVDLEGPSVGGLTAIPNPVPVGSEVALLATVDDTEHGATPIYVAAYALDSVADADFVAMTPTDGAYDSVTESVAAVLPAFAQPGVHTVTVRAWDAMRNVAGPEESLFLPVYDPSGGFVTGGGWILSPEGAFHPDLAEDAGVTGKATFGFVAKYQKGANLPTGNAEFQFKAGNLNFKSTSYDWLVVAGARAQFKGTGTIYGMEGTFEFILTAIDGDLLGGAQPDRFRIKIWLTGDNEEVVIYDNQAGADDTAGLTKDGTVVQGGSVVVHKP